jgi:outer membrane protein insertion porin family
MAHVAAALVALALSGAVQDGAPPAPDAPSPDEGAAPLSRRWIVERVRFEGLSKTRASEVRKHLLLREGDLLDDQAVLLSRLRLVQLGWFRRVETRVERGSARGQVVLVFTVEERNTLLVSDLWFGSTDPQPFYGGLGLAEHNFLGRGLGLSGAFVYGGTPPQQPLAPSRLSLRGAFAAPDLSLLGGGAHLGLSALWIRGEELTCRETDCAPFSQRFGDAPRLRYTRGGGAVEVGTRTTPFARVLAGLRVERLSVTPFAGLAATLDQGGGPAPFVKTGRSTLVALTVGYLRDTRDDPFFPRSGTRLDAGLTFGSRALGGGYDYSRYLVQLEADLAPLRDHGLRLQGALGAVQGDAPFFERFYAADWAYFSLGPALGRALDLNFSTDSRYDRYLAMGGAEWGIPLWTGGRAFHRGYLALGARALWTSADADAPRTRASRTPLSAEAALRFDTPVGAFNLSLGYLLDNFL